MTPAGEMLLHPIRLRIVQALVGSPMTPLQLKHRLQDVPQASLYRHVNQLLSGGLIHVVEERQVRGTLERTYAVVEQSVSLSQNDLAGATEDDHFRFFATFVGALVSDYGAYLDRGEIDLAADRVGYRQVPLWLTDEEFDEMVEEMGSAVQARLDNEPGPGRQRRLLSTIVMPDVRAPSDP